MSSGRSAVARMVALSGSNQSRGRDPRSRRRTPWVFGRRRARIEPGSPRRPAARTRARRGFAAGGRDERERGRAQDRDDDRDHRAMPRHRAPGRSQQRLGLGTPCRCDRDGGAHPTRVFPYASRLPAEGSSYETPTDHPRNREERADDRYVDRYRCAESIDSEEFPFGIQTIHHSSSLPDRTELFHFFRTRETTAERFRVTPLSEWWRAAPGPPARRESERPRARSLGARSTSVVCFHSLKN